MTVPSRVLLPGLAVLVLGAAATPRVTPPDSQTTAPSDLLQADLNFIVLEAQRAQKADVEAWTSFKFTRLVVREEFDEADQVVDRQELKFVVTPGKDGFREDLVRLNGREPDPDEKHRERRAGGFNKHYRTLVAGAGGEEEEGGYSLGQLLHLSSYRFAGREVRDGVACYRLDFSPDDSKPARGGLAAKFTDAMAGSLWITVEGFHLAGARATTVRPISIALSLSKVYDLQVSLEAQPVGEGVWLPRRLELRTHARVLIKPIRRRNSYVYSDFLRVVPPG